MSGIVLDTWFRFTIPGNNFYTHIPSSMPAPFADDLGTVRGWGVWINMEMGWQVFSSLETAEMVERQISRNRKVVAA